VRRHCVAVRTIRAAAQLLADAATVDDLLPIARALGCAGSVRDVDRHLRADINLEGTSIARIVEGPGALRALLLQIDSGASFRDLLARTATRLASRAPHVLWIVLATEPSTRSIAITAWRNDRHPPRVAALVCDRARVVDSDAETLATLAALRDERPDADVLTHERWVDVLGRDSLTKRFYRALELRVDALATSLDRGTAEARHDMALLYASRLLFLCFLEAKGWLDADRAFLARSFDGCMERGGHYHRRVLLPLFFGTLNTRFSRRAPAARALGRIPFLNGGLFARTPNERQLKGAVFPDEEIGKLFGDLFARYRFTAREESTEWAELAVDPEMLGKAFESLMASRDRKGSGSFYTPHTLVSRVAEAALGRSLPLSSNTCHADSVEDAAMLNSHLARDRLARLTILDPACGSGAFLVYALERLAELRIMAGDDRPIAEVRRNVLMHSIFGVDKNPTAVWLCELRLWLSVVIESDVTDPLAVRPLPNLDRNVRVGDSLTADAFTDSAPVTRSGDRLRVLRERYVRASGRRKDSLVRQLDREERRIALDAIEREILATSELRRDLLGAMRGHDLFGQRTVASSDSQSHAATLRARAAALRVEHRRLAGGGALPFSFRVHFADVAARGGFDVILGNPPWVRLHRIPVAEREWLRDHYRVFRNGAWESGAVLAHAGRGFATQVDLAALFIERSVRLLRPGATLALLVPMKLWQSLAGGGVRRLLVEETRLVELEDLAEAPGAFEAAVYPSLLVTERWSGDSSKTPGEILAATHRRGCGAIRWRLPRRGLAFDDSPGSPWLVLPPDVRAAFDRLSNAGIALGESSAGRPHLGVKTGFNLAYVVGLGGAPGLRLREVIAANGRRAVVEESLLRPVVRGEDIQPWRIAAPNEYIVWTHGPAGLPLDRLPPNAGRWFGPWRRPLSRRADARGARWWSLFRVDAARTDRPRVIWADLGRTPRATILPAGDPSVPLNSCYVALCRDERDALTVAAVLNSPLAEAWLGALAEPARGGYRRFLGWTMALLPVPADWERARTTLAPIAEQALAGCEPREVRDALLEKTLAAYGLRHADVAPLLAWFAG